jgi:hypothetical protein
MRLLLATAAALGALFLLGARTASGPLPYQSPDRTEGTVACASTVCHGSLTPWKQSNVLQNEYVTWTRLDKHAQAYAVLQNAQSKKIAKNLGLEKPASQSALCLDCHSHNVPKKNRSDRFVLTDGVTCEACHGPAGRWISTHDKTGRTAEQNQADGLYPLQDAAARAKLCLSCHGGNADRFVTHRIMSAGHPRISFELETFSMIEPAHFATSRAEHPSARPWNGARVWATGQAVAVSQTMQLLMNPARNHDGPFPELVLYDCNGCHHPMSDKRWKPQTAFGGNPPSGIVRLNDANLLMLRVIARQIDPALGEKVTRAAVTLQEANAGVGDLQAAAQDMKDAAEDAQVKIASVSFTPALMSSLASGIIEDGQAGHFLDYAGAEQAYMSLSSIVDFMNRNGALGNADEVNGALGKLNDSLASDETYKPAEFQSRLGALKKLIH